MSGKPQHDFESRAKAVLYSIEGFGLREESTDQRPNYDMVTLPQYRGLE